MEHITQLIRTYMISESPGNELDEIVSDVASGKATLLHVVKDLGDFLTSEDANIRGKGVGLLSSLLQKCPEDILTKQSVHVLIVFYCDKLDDIDTVIPALKGLIPLTNSTNCTGEDAVRIMQSIFQDVNMKAHIQSNRLIVLMIIDNLLSRHREALKNMKNEFLRGYVQLVEGEKDPRNLMITFSIARVILIEFDISNYIEDYFDITFCYFPISFRPPPDDPYGITADDLKKALRACLCATPRFGPLAMPLFLDKLTAGSGVTKRDTMQTIAECLPVYGTAIARNHASKLWNTLKIEIFQPIDQETANCALETTQVLITLVYANTNGGAEGIGKQIVDESLEYLKEPEKSKAKPAVKVMAALIRTTRLIRRFTISKTVPCLIALFRDPAEIINRPATLTALETVIAAVRTVFVPQTDKEDRQYTDDRILDEYKDDLLGIFTVGLKTATTILPSLKGLDLLVQIPTLLSDEELGFVVHSVNEILETTDISPDHRPSALAVLASVSKFAPKIIEDTTLPLLFGSLPDISPSRDSTLEHTHYRQALDNLVSLCIPPQLFETFIIRLSTKLDLIFSRNNVSDIEANAAYAHYVLLSIFRALTRKSELGHMDMPKFVDRLLPRIYKLFIQEEQDGRGPSISDYPLLIETAGKVIEQVIRTVSAERQTTFIVSLFQAFLYGQVQKLSEQHVSIKVPLVPFELFTNPSQFKLMPLFTYPIIALRKEVGFPVDSEVEFVSTLAVWSLDMKSSHVESLSVMHAVASIINKRGSSDFVSRHTFDMWRQYIIDEVKNFEQRRRVVQLWIWITKALMVRGDMLFETYTEKLFSLFADAALRWDAARALGEIGKGGEDILTKKNFAVIKILTTQKYFNFVLPRIMEGIVTHKVDMEQQAPYLIALTSLIKFIPKAIYAHQMPKLLPLLLRGLDLSDLDLRIDIIETLHATSGDINQKDDAILAIISEHAPRITLAMLKNSQIYDQPLGPKLRQVAIKYLSVLPEIVRYDILHPYKAQVLRELVKCLDDPKRAVRKEAVDTRANCSVTVVLSLRLSRMRLRPLISRSISSTRIRYESRKDRFNFNDSIFDEESILNYSQFKRVTAGDLATSKEYPKNVTMLVRDFIQDSLYNPHYGYFSKQAVIFSSKEPLDFPSIRNSRELENQISQTYGSYGSTVRGLGRQIWHTPTELFKPWYGRAIAQFILSEYMLRGYPYDDLVIYEIGGGNGTLANDILNFIQQEYPAEVYERIRYNIIEISPQLAKIQGKRLRLHPNVKVFNKSVFDWDIRDNSACFFIALEVIDNFPHDEIRYSMETREPYQGIVAIDEWGDFYRLYESVSDPLISNYLNLRTTVGRVSPAIPSASPLLRRLRSSLPFSPNLSKSEFIPTRLLELLYLLRDKFPRHRLLLSDFSSLPDTIPGYHAPVVQTRIRDVMVPCQTFLVKQGFFDIFFPTAFNLLRDMYEHIMSQPYNAPLEGSRASPLLTMAAPSDLGANFFFSHNRRPLTDTITSTSGLPVGGHRSSVFSHKEFMQTYAAVEQTQLKTGENPLLEYYQNVKFFF